MLTYFSINKPKSEERDGHSWNGEFADPALETLFRAATWGDMRRQMTSVLIAACVFAAFGFVDLYLLGLTSQSVLVTVARFGVFGFVFLLFKYAGSPEHSNKFFAVMTAAELYVVCAFLASTSISAWSFANNFLVAVVMLSAIYFVLPNRLGFNLLAASVLTAGSIYVMQQYPGVHADNIIRMVLLQLVVNIIGFQAIRSSGRLRRREFLRLLHEQDLNEQLIEEMTSRQKAQDSVRESEENFHSIFVSAPLALALIEPKTLRIINANKAATDLFGMKEGEANGVDARIFMADYEAGNPRRDQMPKALSGRTETRMRTADGRFIWAQISQSMVQFEGRPAYLVGGQDVTSRREEAGALREARDEARAASRSKSEFLANISHELRTPLNAIIGFSEALEREIFGPVGNARYREYAEDIHDSGVHLLNLINDILDLSKIEAGQFKLYEDETQLGDVINSACRIVRHRAMQSSISVESKLDTGNVVMVADERALKQIFINLLSNAIKFSHNHSTVYIHSTLSQDGIRIAVVDQGIGIAKADIPLALAPFTQIDGTLARAHEGTGLGLPLAKHLVELHGGTLTIESEPGKGTTINVDLPAFRLAEPQKSRAVHGA